MNEILLWLATAPPAAPEATFSLQLPTIVNGGLGAALVGLFIYVGRLLLDRFVPSRTDARASYQMVLDGLNNMVKVLQEEKLADAERLKVKQARIDELENMAERDYTAIRELRAERDDLERRIHVKDRHIAILVNELRKLGREVTGLDIDEDPEVTVVNPVVKPYGRRSTDVPAEDIDI